MGVPGAGPTPLGPWGGGPLGVGAQEWPSAKWTLSTHCLTREWIRDTFYTEQMTPNSHRPLALWEEDNLLSPACSLHDMPTQLRLLDLPFAIYSAIIRVQSTEKKILSLRAEPEL